MGRRCVLFAIAFVAMVFLLPADALARCVCRCVGEEVQALCDSTLDIPPICPPKICPIAPPSIPPIGPPSIPPIGTERCWQEQILNPYTGRYEWHRVCR